MRYADESVVSLRSRDTVDSLRARLAQVASERDAARDELAAVDVALERAGASGISAPGREGHSRAAGIDMLSDEEDRLQRQVSGLRQEVDVSDQLLVAARRVLASNQAAAMSALARAERYRQALLHLTRFYSGGGGISSYADHVRDLALRALEPVVETEAA